MAGIVRCRGDVYYQVDWRVAIGRGYYMPERNTTTYKLKHEAVKSSV
jgi:DNA helicase IV